MSAARRRFVDAATLSGILLAAAALFSRGLGNGPSYDEGVYLASVDALDRGEQLGEEIFASQPPGFYALLQVATALPGDSVDATRAVFVAIALLGVAATWALGRALAGPLGGLAGAAILLAAPAYASESSRIAAGAPSIALALVGLALLAWSLRWSSLPLAAAAGLTLAAAASVKLLAVTALVPALALLVAFRPRRAVVAAFVGGGAVMTLLLLAYYARTIGALYDDSVSFHTDAREVDDDAVGNVERVIRWLHPRTVFTALVAIGAIAWLVRGARPRLLVPLWLWVVASAGFLAWHRPLLDHHFVLLAAALAVAAGAALGGLDASSRKRQLVAGALVLVLAAGYAQQWRRIDLMAQPEPDVEATADAVAAETRPGDTIVSDLPIVAHLADRELPGELVDTSNVRFDAGSLNAPCVLAAADAAAAEVAVVGRMFRFEPAVLAGLSARFPERHTIGSITIFERSPAAARAARQEARGSCANRDG